MIKLLGFAVFGCDCAVVIVTVCLLFAVGLCFVCLLLWIWLLGFNSVVKLVKCRVCLVLFGACCFERCLICSWFTCW